MLFNNANKIAAIEARWWMSTSHFQCIAKCSARPETKKPALLERVFTLNRKEINCLTGAVRFGLNSDFVL